jgi:hypothetical protein
MAIALHFTPRMPRGIPRSGGLDAPLGESFARTRLRDFAKFPVCKI